MKLWKITPPEWLGYESFTGAIVAAPSADEARAIHPGSKPGECFIYPDAGGGDTWDYGYGTWVSSPSEVTATLVGTAEPGTTKGVVLAAFHAG